ncbi:hypothetical protein KR222_006998 [Zaprionus bogoriensis]|nr:hypothetical protein KR222_006998 [Zaprionus bogoriensis]
MDATTETETATATTTTPPTTNGSATTTTTTDDDYVTVVEVDDPTSSTKDTNHLKKLVKRQSSVAEDSSFITVLTINEQQQLLQQQQREKQGESEYLEQQADAGEHVTVYRLPGERLGFGLRFQGGTRNTELVHKLYIQSCAADSPASKVATSWGHLREGDEILSIDERQVQQMTRIDCVRCLKDNVAIKLIVRNGHGQKPPSEEEQQSEVAISLNAQPPPPPPVPPRKLVKRQNSKEGPSAVQLVVEKPLTPPPDAEYYINLFAESLKAGSESDDTASTISTVIDKLSMGSNYSSDTELAGSINAPELAKLVQPFTLLEQEFQLEQPLGQPTLVIPGNNYENVEFKTEKVNVYENVELTPTPKPRVLLPTPESKKRSIIPMPRKIATPSKQAIEVPPPRVPTDEPESPKTPTNEPVSVKEFSTRIPKAKLSVSPAFSRAKTEGEIKLHLQPTKQQSPQLKSRIPIVSSVPPKSTKAAISPSAASASAIASSNIPRLLQKQKSETDLKLNFYCSKSKESSPSPGQLRAPLQRANSAEAPARTPERTFIPVLLAGNANGNGTNRSSSNSNSSESLSSICSNSSSGGTSNGRSPKGPKPKPPERVQSLQKTQIPKLQTLPTTPPQARPKLSMQTFKQHNGSTSLPATPRNTPLNTPSPTSNREIRFKIQTYESKAQDEDKLPSLFDLVHRQDTTQEAVTHFMPMTPTHAQSQSQCQPQRDITALLAAVAAETEDLSRESPPPLLVGKCTKVAEDNPNTTCYSSSSSDEDDDAEADDVDAAEREYICEDGEKLGPPELINGPGPSEAYFNMYWHSNMLPTIGEVEEEFSSLEPQSLTNGAIVEELKKLPSKVPVKMEAQLKCDDKIVAEEAADPQPQSQPKEQQALQNSTTNQTKSETTSSSIEETSQSSTKTQRTVTTKVVTTKTSSSSSSSSSSSTSTCTFKSPIADVAFKLQPYEEREGQAEEPEKQSTTTTTVREERRVVSEQKVLSELRTRDALTGEDKLLTSAESKSSSARFKKISSNDNLLELDDVEQLQPLTATVSAETRLTERLDNPQDKQSIETGTLTLSERGKQLQLAENGISYTECEETEQQSYLQSEQILSGEQPVDAAAEATLQRELSETLTVSKDGEKQVTKRLEQSKETANKKGAKLLKKTDEERRLEEEAKKLIESYQKVKKEAEKLYKLELDDDEQGFDLSAFEQAEGKVEPKVEAPEEPKQDKEKEPLPQLAEEIKTDEVRTENVKADEVRTEDVKSEDAKSERLNEVVTQSPPIEDDLGYVLHKYIIDSPKTKEPKPMPKQKQKQTPQPQPKTKPKPPVPSNKPKLASAVVKPKTAPPPVPSKRSDPGLIPAGKPTPTQRRSSLELTPAKPTPLERIIVGVEQSPIVNLASVDLPNVAASPPSSPGDHLIAQAEDLLPHELHFESHQLPNAEKQQRQVEGRVQTQVQVEEGEAKPHNGTVLSASSSMTSTASSSSSSVNTPITTPILVSATSSLDSVKSVIEVINAPGTECESGIGSDSMAGNIVVAIAPAQEELVQAEQKEQGLPLVEDVSTLMETHEGAHETGESRAHVMG